jgi:lycopene beta-cyclase
LKTVDADLILVGGGLANSLIALQLAERQPRLKILLLESNARLGGNHTWCFHTTDVTDSLYQFLRPLIEKSWPTYDIRFPERSRTLQGGYNAILSDQLDRVTSKILGDRVICNARAATVTANAVELDDGRRFTAAAVIDGRGDTGNRDLWICYQKFIGQVIQLDQPHGLSSPLLIDATVAQRGGFRFMYVLPFAHDQLLIEDTRYSDTPALEHEYMRNEIQVYAARHGWRIEHLVREEEGVLPVVLGGNIQQFWAHDPGVPRSGIRAGLFNYTTGYSLPEAARCAHDIATLPKLSSEVLYAMLRRRSESLWRRGRFLRMLNRMLFLAAEPEQRYRVLQHFYRLPDDTVRRFYAGQTGTLDRVRILSGRPPVPIAPAIKAILATQTINPA